MLLPFFECSFYFCFKLSVLLFLFNQLHASSCPRRWSCHSVQPCPFSCCALPTASEQKPHDSVVEQDTLVFVVLDVMSPTYFSHHRVVHKLYKRCHIRQMQCHLDSCRAVSMIHSHGVRVLLLTRAVLLRSILYWVHDPTISARNLKKLKGFKIDDDYGHRTFRDSPCFAFAVFGALLVTASIMSSTNPLSVLSCSLSTRIPAVTSVTCHLLMLE